jgi:hypothetical protein
MIKKIGQSSGEKKKKSHSGTSPEDIARLLPAAGTKTERAQLGHHGTRTHGRTCSHRDIIAILKNLENQAYDACTGLGNLAWPGHNLALAWPGFGPWPGNLALKALAWP